MTSQKLSNMTAEQLQAEVSEVEEWTLDTDQMVFMMQHHNQIAAAYANDDMEALRQVEQTDEYRHLFNGMSFDEAYDRYESTFE